MFTGNHSRGGWPSVGVVLAGLLLCGAVGCGGSVPFEVLPVSGKVTYEDGSEDGSLTPAVRVKILFTPQVKPIDARTYPRPGFALVNVDDGRFGSGDSQVSTVKFGDGVIVGPHEIKVFGVFVDDKNQEEEIQLEVTPSEIKVGPESTEFEFKVKRP